MPSELPETEILNLERRQLYPRGNRLNLDYLVDRRPILDRTTPIASIGSCFASRIKRQLEAWDFNYLQTSDHPAARPGSAAWGTVFNSTCVLQECQRAVGEFHPTEEHWVVNDSLWSPYRKKVRWADVAERDAERGQHAEDARSAFQRAEALVITLGLTEVWWCRVDGAAFYQVPPTEAFDPERHAFSRMASRDVWMDLRRAAKILDQLNPELDVILTVSPVPLRATFRDRDAVTANAESKATLLIAAHHVCEELERWHYFPSYELVTTVLPDPLKKDNRHVTPATEERVMELFERTFCR